MKPWTAAHIPGSLCEKFLDVIVEMQPEVKTSARCLLIPGGGPRVRRDRPGRVRLNIPDPAG